MKYALGPACVAGAGVVSGWVMGAAVVVGTGLVIARGAHEPPDLTKPPLQSNGQSVIRPSPLSVR